MGSSHGNYSTGRIDQTGSKVAETTFASLFITAKSLVNVGYVLHDIPASNAIDRLPYPLCLTRAVTRVYNPGLLEMAAWDGGGRLIAQITLSTLQFFCP